MDPSNYLAGHRLPMPVLQHLVVDSQELDAITVDIPTNNNDINYIFISPRFSDTKRIGQIQPMP